MPRNGDDSSIDRVRLLTWNILAPCFVTTPPSSLFGDLSFDRIWPAYSDWSYREEKIAHVLADSMADVICLQEVQVSKFDGLAKRLNDLGYDAHIQETENHPIANVILLSRTLKWTVLFKESRSRALILGIQSSESDLPPFFLVNVHLQASSDEVIQTAQTRFSQVVGCPS